MTNFLKQKKESEASKKKISELFQKIDINKDLKISMDELRAYIGDELSADKIQVYFFY